MQRPLKNSLAAIAAFWVGMATPAHATPDASLSAQSRNDKTKVTGIQTHATFHNVGVQVDFKGDRNRNATAILEADINGSGFQPMHRMSRVGKHRFVGTVFDLDPLTSVTVRVVVTDPDGIRNATQVSTIITRDKMVPVSLGNEIHVSTTGSDQTGNGSVGQPYATIQKAVNQSNPGDKVMIHTGTYHQSVSIDFGPTGTPGAPLTITEAGDGPVILDGSDPALNNPAVWTSEGGGVYSASVENTFYVGIDGKRMWRYDSLNQLQTLAYGLDGGFYVNRSLDKIYLRLPGDDAPAGHQIQVSTLHHAFEFAHTSDIVIDGLTFKNHNLDPFSSSISLADGSERMWVVNSVFEQTETGVRLEAYVADTVVMNNEFSDQGVNDFHWELVKAFQGWLEHGALFVSNDEFSGFGTIFCNNYIHDYFDGVKIVGTEILPYASNSDVRDNFFLHLSDDGVETDGYASNVRITHNRFEDLLVGVSVAPALGGPVYIVRNQMVDLNNVAFTNYETSAIKFNIDGVLSGETFAYHNTGVTFEQQNAALSVTNDSNWIGLTMKNNIWQGTQRGMYYHLDNILPVDQDYDLFDSTSGALVLFQGTDFFSIASYFNATGLCQNGVAGDPLFVNSGAGDYRLQAGSPAIDAGVIIQGINNQGFLGVGPDIGAFEF